MKAKILAALAGLLCLVGALTLMAPDSFDAIPIAAAVAAPPLHTPVADKALPVTGRFEVEGVGLVTRFVDPKLKVTCYVVRAGYLSCVDKDS